METNKIPLTHRNSKSLLEERRNPPLEPQGSNLDDRIPNMVRIMSRDVIGSLISMSATLKLLSRGYYGKMDESVANNLKDLLSKAVGLIGITVECLGAISFQKDYTKNGRGYKVRSQRR